MKRSVLFLVAVTAAVFAGRIASAQDAQYISNTEITATLDAYEQRIAALEGHDGCGCDDCCMDPCCRSCGVVGGFEVAFLRPHSSLGVSGAFGQSIFDLEYDFEATPRLWIGYQGCNGLGVRARYWEFDHDVQGTFGAVGGPFIGLASIDTYVMNIEMTDVTELGCNWDATVFGGIRYVDYVETRAVIDTAGAGAGNVFARQFNSDSIGPTAGGELRWCVRENVALFGIARTSLLFGTENEWTADFGPRGGQAVLADHESNNVYHITELQLGVEATRPLCDGGYGFARAAIEASEWNNFIGEGGFDGGEASGFAGFTFAVGIVR